MYDGSEMRGVLDGDNHIKTGNLRLNNWLDQEKSYTKCDFNWNWILDTSWNDQVKEVKDGNE